MTGRPTRNRLRVGDWPWHPMLVGLAVVLAFWVDQPVSPLAAIRLVPGALAVMAVITVALWLLLRDPHRAGMAATALIALAWSKHAVLFVAESLPRLGTALAVIWLAVIGLAVALAVRIATRHARAAWRSERASRRLNLAAVILLAATLISAVASGSTSAVAVDLRAQGGTAAQLAADGGQDQPDIYVFLLDMYARSDVLRERYDLDNSPFLDALAARGFEVADESRSAYPYTHLALPSLLHMDYMESIPPMRAVFSGEAPVRPTIRLAINQNPAFDILRERGYEVHSVSSGFEDYTIRHAEVFWDAGQLNEFELQFLESTFVGDLLMVIDPDLASGQLRERIRSTLAYAPMIAERGGDRPRLVFVHVPAPHTPIVLGPEGEPVVARLDADFFQDRHVKLGLDPEGFTAAYRGEVEYLNGLVLDAVDGVLEAGEEDPIILVMSDHGPSSGVDWDGTPRDDLPAGAVRERIANLFAAYTPGGQAVFPADVSIVNVFRHLFDAYFDTNLGTASPPSDGVQFELP